jgi:hypothetical protein
MALSGFRVVSMIPIMRTPFSDPTADADLAQMERWVAWVIRLTSHAAGEALDAALRARLEGATEDAESLREALVAAESGWLEEGQVAIVRSVYDLWDANHHRTEQLAAAADPIWYLRWRDRSAGARPERTVPTGIERSLSPVG